MNCKPGDLAYIAKNCEGNVHHFVSVKFASGRRDSGQHWWVCQSESDLLSLRDGVIKAGDLVCIADCDLRPIRDPGDDAQDETLTWLPVPTTEGVPA